MSAQNSYDVSSVSLVSPVSSISSVSSVSDCRKMLGLESSETVMSHRIDQFRLNPKAPSFIPGEVQTSLCLNSMQTELRELVRLTYCLENKIPRPICKSSLFF